MFAWEVLPQDNGALPLMTGVTADQDQAREHAGAVLARDDSAFLARVEAVRPSLWRPAEYQRTGQAWLGRRAAGGGVRWGEWSRPGGAR